MHVVASKWRKTPSVLNVDTGERKKRKKAHLAHQYRDTTTDLCSDLLAT